MMCVFVCGLFVCGLFVVVVVCLMLWTVPQRPSTRRIDENGLNKIECDMTGNDFAGSMLRVV